MILNGFNSDNYRYFVDESGNIFKYQNDLISTFCFAGSSTCYPKDEPFDLSRFIKMQDKITFNSDSYIQLSFQAGDHIIISDFLDSKLFSEKVVWQKLISGPNETFSEINTNKLKNYGTLMQPDERNEFLNSIIEPYNFMKTNQEKEALKIYKFNSSCTLYVPVEKTEVWDLLNLEMALCLLNQSFVNKISKLQEVFEKEKDELFIAEYKDNIPNTEIRYYKIKDSICVKDLSEFEFSCPFWLIDYINVCKYNPNNFREDGAIQYIYAEYGDNNDIWIEKEVLKIADRISQEEALERYNDDTKHIDLANNEREALEYISLHKKAYCVAKRKNPSLTCVDFFNMEQEKQRRNCGYRLIKALKQRARSIS